MNDLPDGWVWTTLGEVCEKPQYGWTTKAAQEGAGLKLLRTTDITRGGAIEWTQVPYCQEPPADPTKYVLHADDIVVSRAGSIGASAKISAPPPAVFASYLIRLRPKLVDPAYVSWFLQSPEYWSQVRSAAAGIALQNINAKKLAAVRMPLAPLAEQRRIVAAIEEQFSRLEVGDHAIERARLRARLFREAALEEAFESDWPARSLADIASLTDGPFGSNLKTSHYVSSGPRVVRLQNIGDGSFRDERAHITHEHFEQLSKHEVLSGDVVAASLGVDAPRACIIPAWLGSAIVKADCIRIRPHQLVDGAYLMWSLNSRPIKRQAANRIKGIGRPRLGVAGLRALQIPLPPIDEQRRIVTALETKLWRIDSLLSRARTASQRSAALRRSILARAFRGELVLQDPNEEPASSLLERIATERAAAPNPVRKRRETAPA